MRKFNPFLILFVLCEDLWIMGKKRPFGSKVNPALDLKLVPLHYVHGVLGTKEELDALQGTPLETTKHSLQPKALSEQPEVAPVIDTPVFSPEALNGLKSKQAVCDFMELFDVKLKPNKNVSLPMLKAAAEDEMEAKQAA